MFQNIGINNSNRINKFSVEHILFKSSSGPNCNAGAVGSGPQCS